MVLSTSGTINLFRLAGIASSTPYKRYFKIRAFKPHRGKTYTTGIDHPLTHIKNTTITAEFRTILNSITN